MMLEWFSRKKRKKFTLEVVQLKKIVAVSDEYWAVLYQPIVDVVERCIGIFSKNNGEKISADYIEQFVKLVRRSKGGVYEDALVIHAYTYSLVLSFSALYVGRMVSKLEFQSISTARKSKGDRGECYPWLSVPDSSVIKIRNASRVWPVYVRAMPVLFAMVSKIGWEWLHGQSEIMKSLIDAVYSNGEKGSFAGLLGAMVEAPLRDRTRPSEDIGRPVVYEEKGETTSGESGEQSLEDFISELGGGSEEKSCSLEELLEGGKSKTNGEKKEAEHAPKHSNQGALDEFKEFLSGAKDVGVEREMDGDLSEEVGISDDLIKWCLSKAKNNSKRSGVYVIEHDGKRYVALDKVEGVLNFVRDDYDLSSEKEYKGVADEVLRDLVLSSEWVANPDGGENWKCVVGGEEVLMILLKEEVGGDVVVTDEGLVLY